MRRLIAPLGFIGLLSLAPLAVAMTAPLSEEELTEAADLIAHGHISDVLCLGEPFYDGQSTTTAYHAILTLDAVFKPEDSDLTSVTLPFATVVWDEDQPPAMCGWTPSYLPEERGTYYLTTGVDTELYTLVSWNAFVADDDSAGEALPSCEEPEPEPDTTASEDVSESTEDTSEVGPEDVAEPGPGPDADDAIDETFQCVDDSDCGGDCSTCNGGICHMPPHCPDCFSDSDCAEGKECYWTNNEGDAYCRDIESSSGSSDGGDSGDSGDSGGSGGCASGGSEAPLTLALLVLGLVALTGRRRVLG